MLIVEAHGRPVAEALFAANHHEVKLVVPTIEQGLKGLKKPENLLGDKAYYSSEVTTYLHEKYHIHFIATPKKSYKNLCFDRRRFRRIARRWKVERCFAWLKYYRRIQTRWEVYAENYLGFVRLACAMILLKS